MRDACEVRDPFVRARGMTLVRLGNDLYEVTMEDGSAQTPSPVYSAGLLRFILDNPRGGGDGWITCEFSVEPGNMRAHRFIIDISDHEVVGLRNFLSG